MLNQQPGCEGAENRDMMNKIMEGLGARALNLACGEFESERKCRTMKVPKRRRTNNKQQSNQRRPNSYLLPVLDVLNTL